MGLAGSLGRIDIRPPEELEIGTKRLDVYEDAIKAVVSRGLDMPGLPTSGYRGEMPSDVTSLDDNGLGDMLSNLSQFIGYVEAELAKADIARESATSHMEFVEARIRIGIKAHTEGKLTVQDKNDMVITDPRFNEAKSRVLYTEAVYKLTKTIRDKAQRNWETISRRITQRGQEIDRMKRESNVAGVPIMAGRAFRRP